MVPRWPTPRRVVGGRGLRTAGTTIRGGSRCGRGWTEHPSPSGRELAAAGLVAPHWPKPYGLDADPVHQLVIDEELRRAGVARPANPVGIGWAGPTLLHAGTQAQQERYLPRLLSGEEVWCQLFSEPGAGSDLASLTTGRCATATSGSSPARRSGPRSPTRPASGSSSPGPTRTPKHRGHLVLRLPDGRAGVTVRPIIEMTGAHMFNEVFLDDVRLSADDLVGEEGQGWELAKVTLANERVSLSTGGACGVGVRPPRTCWPSCGPGTGRRPDAARPDRPPAHRGRTAAPDPPADGERPDPGRATRARGVGPQGAGRRARPAPVPAGQGPGGGGRDAHRSRTCSASP